MKDTEKNLNALLAIIISFVNLGAFAIQYFYKEVPCSLCLTQRLAMLGVASGALMNIRYGIRKTHYGLSLLFCTFGGFTALRQIALHVCPDFPTFGKPFWGLSLYTWSFFLFSASVTYIAIMLLFFDRRVDTAGPSKVNWWGQLAFALVLIVSISNIFVSLALCGLGAC